MKVTVSFETNGAAFGDPDNRYESEVAMEIKRIFHRTVYEIATSVVHNVEMQRFILDVNGNSVGAVTVSAGGEDNV